MKPSRLVVLGLITLIGFPLAGWVLLLSFGESASMMLRSNWPIGFQILLGIGVGASAGYAAVALLETPMLRPAVRKYIPLVAQMKLSAVGIVALSFCAGFGEELFFRGALQPLLGIWITAIIFVAIHGYLNPKNWRISLYGVFMTLAIALLGYFTELAGIWAACVAHMMIDVVLFRFLVELSRKRLDVDGLQSTS